MCVISGVALMDLFGGIGLVGVIGLFGVINLVELLVDSLVVLGIDLLVKL
jgi:hypothetical protein